MRIDASALSGRGGSPAASRADVRRSTICSPAGQIATTAATRSLTAAGVDREQPAHARAAHGDPALVDLGALREKRDDALNVGDHARTHVALALAVAAVVEGERDEAVARRGAREVGVVLLARAGAVEDHDRRGGIVGERAGRAL